MSYWDTSALIKLYAKEADSAAFETQALSAAGPAVISRIGLYEARATFVRKEAEGALTTGAAQILYHELLQDIAAGEVLLIELASEVDKEYGNILEVCYRHIPVVPLRTLDALHLASARVARNTEIIATDKRLRDAAKVLGFSVFPV